MYSKFMELALQEARTAFAKGEVPVGAVIVKGGEVISTAHNLVETLKDATAHAEMLAIREAGSRLGGWRLKGCTMAVTLEPCPMCAGAILQARLDTLVIGALDFEAGAAGSVYNIVQDRRLNHNVKVIYGVMQGESAELLKEFFKQKR